MPDSASADAPPPEGLQGLDPAGSAAPGPKVSPPPAGDSRWSSPSPEELTVLLPDKYHVEARLGQGGMGAIYKGHDNDLDREVAIKLLPPEWAADEQLVSRFRREARTLAKLHHPSIVTIYDFGQTATGLLYFVMEYIAGTDLRKVLRAGGLAPEDALTVIVEICGALQAAHKRGVVHRDIKPENILIDEEGRVKLVDFGIARPPEENFGRLTASGMMIGTPDYMSPEQRTGDVDERTDIYALGVVLYELLTGRPPRGVFPAPSRRVQIDARIDEVVLKALQSDPEERYQTVTDMRTDVDRIRTTPAPVAPAGPEPAPEPARLAEPTPLPTPPPPPPRRRFAPQIIASVTALVAPRRRAAWVLGGAFALLVLLLVVALSSSDRAGKLPAGEAGKTNEVAWHVPGLNDASFGGWTAFGEPKFEVHDGILTLAAPKWSGIASGRTDFVGETLHVEVAGSADVQAWISIRSAGSNAGRDEVTSYLYGHDGQVYAGHAGIDFAWANYQENQRFFESGRGRVGTPAGQFFSLDFSVSAANELTVRTNGRTTAVLTNIAADGRGAIRLCVKTGSLRIRRLEVQKTAVTAPITPAPTPTPTPRAVRTLSVPADFPKIQAAIDAAKPGDTVKVAAGEYVEQLVFKVGIDLIGAGQDQTIVRCAAAAGTVLTVKNCASGTISDLSFEHTEVAPSTPDAGGVCLLGSVVHLRRCGVRRIGGSGIICAEADWSTIEGCEVAQCRGEGVSIHGVGTSTKMVADQVRDNLQGGIEFVAGSSGRAEGNTCENNTLAGIYIADAGTTATMINNRSLNNLADGIAVRLGATAQIEDNVCEGNHNNGIFARGPKTTVTLLRNQARGNRNNGIELLDGTSGRADGNFCEKNPGSGIVAKGVGGTLSMHGNRCLDNQGYGIWVGAAAAAKAMVGDDNVLLRNAKGAFLVDGAATTPAATPAPATSTTAVPTPMATPDAVPDNAALDRELLGTRWSMGAWTLTFKADHRIEVEERNPPPRTWHWWTIDKDTVHIQYAAQSTQYDPNQGTNLVIDPTRTHYVAQSGDPQRAQKGDRLGPVPSPTPGATPTPATAPPSGDKPVDTSAMKQVVNVQFAQSVSGFVTGEDKRWHLAWADGEYQMVCSEGGLWIPPEPLLGGIHLKDFVVEVRGRIVRAADGGWGLTVQPDDGRHPTLGIMVNGQGVVSHRSYDEKGDNPCQTTPWPSVSARKPGSQENTLRVEASGERFRVFINGQLVGALVQPRLKQDSVVYLFSWGNYPPEDCRFQSVQLWVPR